MTLDTRSTGTIISGDGTPIACYRTGDSPPLVLVHGGLGTHGRWQPVLPAFEEHFTVYAVDRRGRGGSGDSAEYTIEREFEDIAAVVNAIGGPAHLLGHSYGALCAMEAALRTDNIAKLVLYEPPVLGPGGRVAPEDLTNRLDAMLAAGNRDDVVVTFMRQSLELPDAVIELMRSQPQWPERLAVAHTLSRELRAVERYRFDPARFRALRTETLLPRGLASPTFLQAAVDTVQAALPNCRVVDLAGQGHAAMDTAPALFTAEVLRFLRDA